MTPTECILLLVVSIIFHTIPVYTILVLIHYNLLADVLTTYFIASAKTAHVRVYKLYKLFQTSLHQLRAFGCEVVTLHHKCCWYIHVHVPVTNIFTVYYSGGVYLATNDYMRAY